MMAFSAVAEAEIATATVESSGVAVTFRIGGSTDIPSDGAPHKTTIQQFELDPKVDYIGIPRHTDAVFRRLTVINKTTARSWRGRATCLWARSLSGPPSWNMRR